MNTENLKDISNNVEALHSFIFSQQSKPFAAINSIFTALLPFCTPLFLSAGEIFPSVREDGENNIILLEEGICSVFYTKTQLHAGVIFAPSVTGMGDSYAAHYNISKQPLYAMIAETDCKYYVIRQTDFLSCADKFDLWHDIARILMQRLILMGAREQEQVGVDSYLKVRVLLIEVWAYPEDYRQQINILKFIQRRTGLSKSRIMKILSELRKGGYISIDNGKLIQVKKLPAAF
ncbi:helix-turn-helix domain-containing protein [Superficieibacter sp. BNK-5]|uniref:winged helix-turn-helix transcriptional regulator n=1 Tax=Superficieibacter sp. BNK-5 TaxID=3376142 RepID=UPI0039BFE1ED